LLTLLKAAMAHHGTVMIDVISPCVTFNDHDGSTKSYKYLKDHDEPVHDVGFIPSFEDIDVDYDHGTTANVRMHDGSSLRLRKLERDFDATNKINSLKVQAEAHEKGEVLTGVLYVNTTAPGFIDLLNVVDQPLGQLPESMTRPPKKVLDEIMADLQ
jgi:2-oxoglutarate/2-oxoacid ferredoxin oxidoreductase subunit beta